MQRQARKRTSTMSERQLLLIIVAVLALSALIGVLSARFAANSPSLGVSESAKGDGLGVKAAGPRVKVLAIEKFEAGEHRKAIPLFSSYLSTHPSDVELREQYALSLWQTGKRKASVAQYERAIAAQPPDAKLNFQLGLLLRQIGETEKSVKQLEIALKMDPTSASYRSELAKSLRDLRRYNASVEEWRTLIKSMPADSPARSTLYTELGITFQAAGNTKKATEAYRLGLKIDPDNAYLKELLKKV